MLVRSFVLMVLVSFSLLVAACSRLPISTATPEPPNTPELIIVGETSGYPDGCSPYQVVDLVMQFFEAYNKGDQKQFTRFFSPGFQWYSDPQGSGFSTSNWDDLLTYFAERHKQNERLQLLALSVNGKKSWHGGVDIAYDYRRLADDLQPNPGVMTRIGSGKGAVECREQKIFVWSMGISAAWEDEKEYGYVRSSCSDESPNADVPSAYICVKAVEEE